MHHFLLALGVFACALPCLAQQQPCIVAQPTASFTIHHIDGAPDLNTDPDSDIWRNAARQTIVKDCTHVAEYPALATTVRSFWTDTDLYFLFECPYTVLNIFEPPNHAQARVGLWNRDVVEMFLGADWTNIRRYREFEIAPTGDWIDLAIDLDRNSYDHTWRSGWKTMARIDEAQKTWYAAARIPVSSVSTVPVNAGAKWRMNLYRIEGLGPDTQRHFMCWQPTCVQKRDANHVPEHFGTLIFAQ